jgi:alpha,alpha-trehalose phosphorylase
MARAAALGVREICVTAGPAVLFTARSTLGASGVAMPSPVTPLDYDAVLFDLDGVLTSTRTVHASAWKRTFDAFLAEWDDTHTTTTAPFDEISDYAAHVDGKPRQDGVRDFLAARGITLPEGEPNAADDELSVWGLGNRKQQLVEQVLRDEGAQVFPGSIAWVRELRAAGLKTAVVSSSRNCAAVLSAAGIDNLFDVRVDGETALETGLPGKPAPQMFLRAAEVLGVEPIRAVVVEDAVAGVEAGRSGGFGLVVGVDRDGHGEALAKHGADLLVPDLSELLADSGSEQHRAGPKAHRLRAAARRILADAGGHPSDPWRIVEHAYNPAYVPQTETLFALGNGYLGIRGSFDEGEPVYAPATLLNGFHETWPIIYPEHAHGLAKHGQTIMPVPDGTGMKLFVDEELISCTNSEVLSFERVLDMRSGTMSRTVVYQLGHNRRITVTSTRFVSFAHRHLAGVRYQVTADHPARVTLASSLSVPAMPAEEPILDPRQSRALPPMQLVEDLTDDGRVVRVHRTTGSDLAVVSAMAHAIGRRVARDVRVETTPETAQVILELDLRADGPVTITKWLSYSHGELSRIPELITRAEATVTRARDAGWPALLAEHQQVLESFWADSEIRFEGAVSGQKALNFCVFQLLQATWRSDGRGMPAKGVTGVGYEGHYFWDTEAYVLPFLIHTAPDVARSLLMHRIRMLPAARVRAREVGCAGALFPWRTISGEEASAFYAAGTAQYHLNADIAYALTQYVHLTRDTDLLFRYGAELLAETARMWAALGRFSDHHDGQFIINKVTGPDEYSTVVDNNLFTNLMAAGNMSAAADAVEQVRDEAPLLYRRLVDRIGLRPSEPAAWRRAAEMMYLPYDSRAGVYLQHDGFLEDEPWDFDGTPKENYPLLLHYHPLVIYRHQVIKQADVVFATVQMPERFTPEQRARIFEYYDPLTTGDSSLSECVQAIAAADCGKFRTAEEYFIDAIGTDIADVAGNLRDGVHVAAAGGAWMALVYGFGGYRWKTCAFSPMLPARSSRVVFPLQIRGSVLEVDIEPDLVTYRVRSGPPLNASHYGKTFTVTENSPVSFPGAYRTWDADPSGRPGARR